VSAAAASPAARTARGSVPPHVARLAFTAIPQMPRSPRSSAARTAATQAAASTSSSAAQDPPRVASPRREMLTARRIRVRERAITASR
jgi:hypothetical protein